MTMKKGMMLLATGIMLATVLVPIVGQTVEPYQAAIDRFLVPYSHGTVVVTVAIGQNDPAVYSLEMWTKGNSVSASVIVDASAPFMLGLAFLEKEDKTTAWWPSIEKEKTFDSSQSEEEVGLGMGRLDRLIWHSEDYEATFAKETETGWEYRVTPRDASGTDFSYGIIAVNKANETLVRANFFDANDEAIETDTVTDYQEITADSGSTFLYPMSFAYEDFAKNKKTTMEYSKIEFPGSIDDSVFTLDFLKAQSASALN
ncbi:MAG: outer membrane lipoprotein-sorting protein [Candidatus Bipolaricaulota bacterium]|nr:outer membrane lipoprotein-sorting protein [Candidatus Bipolaricaulota bacterium]